MVHHVHYDNFILKISIKLIFKMHNKRLTIFTSRFSLLRRREYQRKNLKCIIEAFEL